MPSDLKRSATLACGAATTSGLPVSAAKRAASEAKASTS
jgi:hypothetical protein